jgi:hypothetical protein
VVNIIRCIEQRLHLLRHDEVKAERQIAVSHRSTHQCTFFRFQSMAEYFRVVMYGMNRKA